jgi:hypothetical protein
MFFPALAPRIKVNLSDLTARLDHVTTVVGEAHPYRNEVSYALVPQGADSPPLLLCVAKTGGNHLNEEITPRFSTGIGERFSQTISHLGHAAALWRRCELPL